MRKAAIEHVTVVGAGGTGSIFLTHLCRIHSAWTALGGGSFRITVIDDDVVTSANLARQVFCEADIGSAKASVLAQRASAFFGIEVEARVWRFASHSGNHDESHVIVGCVDNLKTRRQIKSAASRCYWLDMGNGDNFGQVILGGQGLPNLFDLHPELKKAKEQSNQASCSMAEALEKQDLFINSTVANLGAQLLWQLMRKGGLNHHGYYTNLSTGRTVPIPIQ